jgi:hypothetical protein
MPIILNLNLRLFKSIFLVILATVFLSNSLLRSLADLAPFLSLVGSDGAALLRCVLGSVATFLAIIESTRHLLELCNAVGYGFGSAVCKVEYYSVAEGMLAIEDVATDQVR